MVWWVCAVLAGCGFSVAPLRSALDRKDYAGALELTGDDREARIHLAALLLARQAVSDDGSARELLLALDRCDGPGTDAIDRLARWDRALVATQISTILMHRGDRPDRHNAGAYLDSDASDVRAVAATVFGRDLPVHRLLAMTEDVNPVVRGAAVAALCPAQTRAAGAAVRQMLGRDPAPHVRVAAASCGATLGDDAVAVLRDVVRGDDNPAVKKAAVAALLHIGGDEALVTVRACTLGPMTPLSVEAAALLAEEGHEDGRARLRDALSNSRPDVRRTALSLLRRALPAEATAALKDALRDPDPSVAVVAAGELLHGDRWRDEARGTLHRIVAEGGAPGDDAVEILAMDGDPQAIEALTREFADAAQNAPGRLPALLRRHARIPALQSLFGGFLAHERGDVRLAAAAALIARCDAANP
jgi:HEAT repeat protein